MFCGNYQVAKEQLYEAVLKGIKTGWSGEHLACWSWKSSSELVLLNKIKEKAQLLTDKILSDFVEIPVSYCGWVSQRKGAVFPYVKILTLALAELETFWSTTNRNKYQEKRIKSIQKELKKELQLLDFAWSQDDEFKEASFKTQDGNSARRIIRRNSSAN